METFPESDVTDIELSPDGRLYIFGASREVIEILAEIGVADAQRRLAAWPIDSIGQQPAATVRQAEHD
jgi:hypothetical protein